MDTTMKIKMLMLKCGDVSASELARRIGKTPQAIYNKFKRGNYTETDLMEIAHALGCVYDASFTIVDTGEKI